MFFRREAVADQVTLERLLFVGTAVLSVLMPARTRYPKLGVFPWMLYPILGGLMLLPFFRTAALARIMMACIVVYVCFAPLLVDQHPERARRREESLSPCS